MGFLCFWVNLFIAVVFVSDRKLRKLDYVLVLVQTFFDLTISGVLTCGFFGAYAFFNLGWFCAQRPYVYLEYYDVTAHHQPLNQSHTIFHSLTSNEKNHEKSIEINFGPTRKLLALKFSE